MKNALRSSVEKLKSTKWLAIMALIIALKIAVGPFKIPLGTNLNLSASFIVVAIGGMLLGPVAGSVCAILYDIIGFMLFPDGSFFFGYTLTAVLGMLCYAVFFYDQKITILKVILAKALTNFIFNTLLESYWTHLLWEVPYKAAVATRIVKNGILFPIQVIILVLILNLLIPFLSKKKLINPQKSPIQFM